MSRFFIFAVLISSLVACQADSSSNSETGTENTATSKKNTVLSTTSAPSFEIENYTKDEMPRSVVSITFGNRKVKVEDTIGCNLIEKSDYKNHQIPKDAIQACGGWYAGSGDYFYVIQKGDGNYFVLKATVEEQQESNDYGYKEVMNINLKDGITPM